MKIFCLNLPSQHRPSRFNFLILFVTIIFLGACGGGGNSSQNTTTLPSEQSTSNMPVEFSISGTVSGVVTGQSFSLKLNGELPIILNTNGPFSFPKKIIKNSTYNISIESQPLGQTCSIINNSGVATDNVSNVQINCIIIPTTPSDKAYTINGNVFGIEPNTQINLLNNGVALTTLNGNLPFSFHVDKNFSYSISVANNPLGQFCKVKNGAGIANTDIENVAVICQTARLSIIAGSGGGEGYSDGIGSNARFGRVDGNTIDSMGNIYVADWGNNTIRKITPDGVVTTLAGKPGEAGATDGVGSSARFCRPIGIAIDNNNFLYVTETCGASIRKISPTGKVTTLAGVADQPGFANGKGTEARFQMLSGITIDSSGDLYVADIGNNTIRKITSSGEVTTIAGRAGIYGFADGAGELATFSGPNGIAVDFQKNLYVTDSFNQIIRKITPNRLVTTIAGTLRTRGKADGKGSSAMFSFATVESAVFGQSPLSGIVIDKAGSVFVSDFGNGIIRKISTDGVVTTLNNRYLDYVFQTPTGISIDAFGNFYISEDYNYSIRKITPSLIATTIAGKPRVRGASDGTSNNATFDLPESVTVDISGNIYVADNNNGIVRKISPLGVTTTLAGKFYHPNGIAVDKLGNVFVSDRYAHNISKITPSGDVTIFAGSSSLESGLLDGNRTSARFNVPRGLTVDSSNNIYVADSFNQAIRKITPSGEVTTVAGGALGCDYAEGIGKSARFCGLSGVAVDANGNIYTSDSGNASIRKIKPDGTVTTLAGHTGPTYNVSGSSDGVGTSARFSFPSSIAVDTNGNIYVADSGNCTIRMITSIGVVSTIAGKVGQCEIHEGLLPSLVGPLTGLALTPDGQLVFSSNNGIMRITGL